MGVPSEVELPQRLPGWPVWLVGSPVRTARVRAAGPWRQALAVHLVAGLLGAGAVWVLAAWSRTLAGTSPLTVTSALADDVEAIARTFQREPGIIAIVALAVALYLVLAELGLAIIAAMLTAWGAGIGRLREQWWRRLKGLWLLTPHVLVLALLALTPTVYITQSESAALNEFSRQHPWPAYPTTAKAGSPQIEAYSKACTEVTRQREAWQARLPWHLRYAACILVPLWVGVFGWYLRVLLAAAAPRPWSPRSRYPATCEACGYALPGLKPDQTCPECGRSVAASIGPAVRPGAPLDQPGRDFVLALAQSLIEPLFQPGRFGQRLHVHSPARAHRWVYVAGLAMTGLLSWAGMAAIFLYEEWRYRSGPEAMQKLVLVSLPVSMFSIYLVVGMTLLTAALLGAAGRRHGAHVLPAAMQACGYLMPVWLLGGVVFWCSLLALMVLAETGALPDLARAVGMGLGTVIMGTVLGEIGLTWLGYSVLAWRVTRACRWANR